MGMWSTFRSVARFDAPTLDPVERRLRRVASVDDLRDLAEHRLPGGIFDYIDGGAEDERTLARNAAGFRALELRPRVLRDVSDPDPSTTLFGRPLSMPVVLAPTGFTRIAHSAGEVAVARAAGRAGVPCSLSTLGTCSIEAVAAAGSGDVWFQVYTWKDRGLVREMVEQAAAAGYTALWLTVDTAVLGRRERDVRRGMTLPPKLGPRTLVDGVLHPSWTLDFLGHEPITFAAVPRRRDERGDGRGDERGGGRDGSTAVSLAAFVSDQFDPGLSWDDVEWLRSIWDGPLVLKGVQTVEDARQAVAAGVAGVALSNHGGRQLDDAPVPIELVEPVRQEIGDAATLVCDGGVRRGSDVVKALALGADAVSIGRPYLYALAAAGERGVDWLLAFLREGMLRTMALTGRSSVAELDRELVRWRRS